jgi:hypothetical protein
VTETDEPLPFDAADHSLIADEIVDLGIERADELYDEFHETMAAVRKVKREHDKARKIANYAASGANLTLGTRSSARSDSRNRR